MGEFQNHSVEFDNLGGLTSEDRQAILMRGDLRKRSQELKVNALNLNPPESTPEHKAYYERILSLVNREADGEEKMDPAQAEATLDEKEKGMRVKIATMGEIAPNFGGYLYANLAKYEQLAGQDFSEDLSKSKEYMDRATHIPKLVPSNLLPDAITLGIQKRFLDTQELPSKEKIAQAAQMDPELIKSYALVLHENEREDFLKLIPEDQRRQIGIELDTSVSSVLHQSLIEKNTPEEEQRRQVRMRLFRELRSSLSETDPSDKKTVQLMGEALGTLGEDARQLILELIRDETDSREEGVDRQTDHLPRIMKVMIDNFDDWRGNDIILQTAASPELNHHMSIYLFGKLVDKGYLPKDVADWWNTRKTTASNEGREPDDEKFRLDILKGTVDELGVIPNKEILEFISKDENWQGDDGQTVPVSERFERIASSQAEFSGVKSNSELVDLLKNNENKAMIYFLLHGGDDRFNLINNYSFDKFKEMLGLISDLEINERPIQSFKETLLNSGMNEGQANDVITRLRAGHFPLPNSQQAYQEVSFEISENAALNNANGEIGQVLGKDQLGVVLTFPMYREYLEADGSEQAQEMFARMQQATTFTDRQAIIAEINGLYPDFQERIKNDLQDSWIKFGDKMVIETTLDQVLTSDQIQIHGEELLPKLDAKRIDLKRINKELLIALKSENRNVSDLNSEISRKKKARTGLEQGLARQTDVGKRGELQRKIDEIDSDIANLETRRAAVGEMKVDDRFTGLSKEEKEAEVDRLSQEIIALTEKSPSAIFTFITMQVLGEQRLRENDITLVKEMESHLQGPFQTINDVLTYERPKTESKKRTRVGLQYLDKVDRLATMVRFADSKICCFSSSNYEMRVQHNTPNKIWVASINKDPMSFVLSMEMPQVQTDQPGKKVNENIGFIFGSFAQDNEGKLGVMMNGIYYAPGIEDARQVEQIMGGVEKIFEGLPINTEVIATQYGGSVKMPESFSTEPIEMTRLRAIDDGRGRPESMIYDDLATGTDLNKPHMYGGSAWHRSLEGRTNG